jgi:hypothetical protein
MDSEQPSLRSPCRNDEQHERLKVIMRIAVFGDRLASRIFESQVTEVHVRVAAMNIMTALGMPVSVWVGTVAS